MRIIDGSKVQPGDALLGLASSGPHSNGYSLIRKILAVSGAKLDQPFAAGRTLGEALLAPTRIYVKPILQLLEQVEVHAIAHITGGGLTENIPRVLPANTRAVIDMPKLATTRRVPMVAATGRRGRGGNAAHLQLRGRAGGVRRGGRRGTGANAVAGSGRNRLATGPYRRWRRRTVRGVSSRERASKNPAGGAHFRARAAICRRFSIRRRAGNCRSKSRR